MHCSYSPNLHLRFCLKMSSAMPNDTFVDLIFAFETFESDKTNVHMNSASPKWSISPLQIAESLETNNAFQTFEEGERTWVIMGNIISFLHSCILWHWQLSSTSGSLLVLQTSLFDHASVAFIYIHTHTQSGGSDNYVILATWALQHNDL